MDSPVNTAASAPVAPELLGQNDPAVALSRGHTSVSLRARLALFVAVVVGTVVGLGSFLLIQLFERLAVREIRAEAEYTAQAVADELELRSEAPKAETLRTELGPYADLPMVRDVTVVALGPDPWSVTTAAAVRPDRENLAVKAAQARGLVWGERSTEVTLAAVPIVRDGRVFGGVAVAVALDESGQIRRSGRQLAFWFAVVSIILLTLLVDLLVRRLVHRPISSMLATMQRAGAGDIAARTAIARDDELGAVARGLNDMLARLERVHLTQSQRIAEATQALDARNQEIVTSYQRMFALREALARAQQTAAAGKTAANLAHQIGTPLNLISGYVQVMLEDGPQTDPRVKDRLRSIEDQIQKLASFVRATLDATRREPAVLEPVFPAAVLRRIAEVARPRLSTGGITLRLEAPDDLPWLMGDPVQLELALLNLVNNSLDAMPGGGVIGIVARRDGSATRIEVSDTGTGIPAELLPRLFEPWITTKPVGKGTGLGLSIARDVIAAHGGSITVESPPGRGATFTIILPGKPGEPAVREV